MTEDGITDYLEHWNSSGCIDDSSEIRDAVQCDDAECKCRQNTQNDTAHDRAWNYDFWLMSLLSEMYTALRAW